MLCLRVILASCALGLLLAVGLAACSPECPDGYTNCFGYCERLDRDQKNCGTCGNVCPDGISCINGTCDACDGIIGQDRWAAARCLGTPPASFDLAGSHHNAAGVYSLAKLDHDISSVPGTSSSNPYDVWTRHVMIFEHASGQPEVTSDGDLLRYFKELSCRREHWSDGSSSFTATSGSALGTMPVVSLTFDCEDWPEAVEHPTGEVVEGGCYVGKACELGLLCTGAQLDKECPGAGGVCLPAGEVPAGDDLDGDGIANCEDDDIDGDGLTNEEEAGPEQRFPTDPYNPDTDGDGLTDDVDPYPSVPCTAELFFDDFTDDPTVRWETVTGLWDWDGVSEYASLDVTAGAAHVWLGLQSWTDYIVQVRLRLTQGSGAAGVLTRMGNADPTGQAYAHYYTSLFNDLDALRFGFTQNTSSTDLGEVATTVSAHVWYTLQIRHSGTSYEIYLDNKRLLSGSSSAFAEGSVALLTSLTSASFDYVLICQ